MSEITLQQLVALLLGITVQVDDVVIALYHRPQVGRLDLTFEDPDGRTVQLQLSIGPTAD